MKNYCFRMAFLLLQFGVLTFKYGMALSADLDLTEPRQELLDVNQINSSVDAGSFYSIDINMKQIEDNVMKLAQDLKKLKQQIEIAKQLERKHLAEIQKLERVRMNLLDNSLTGSSAKLERIEPEKSVVDLKTDYSEGNSSNKILSEGKNAVSDTLHGESLQGKQEVAVEIVDSVLIR